MVNHLLVCGYMPLIFDECSYKVFMAYKQIRCHITHWLSCSLMMNCRSNGFLPLSYPLQVHRNEINIHIHLDFKWQPDVIIRWFPFEIAINGHWTNYECNLLFFSWNILEIVVSRRRLGLLIHFLFPSRLTINYIFFLLPF